MPTLPRKAAAGLLPALFAAALFATPSVQAYPGGGAAFNGRGFDTCAAPSTSQMQACGRIRRGASSVSTSAARCGPARSRT